MITYIAILVFSVVGGGQYVYQATCSVDERSVITYKKDKDSYVISKNICRVA